MIPVRENSEVVIIYPDRLISHCRCHPSSPLINLRPRVVAEELAAGLRDVLPTRSGKVVVAAHDHSQTIGKPQENGLVDGKILTRKP